MAGIDEVKSALGITSKYTTIPIWTSSGYTVHEIHQHKKQDRNMYVSPTGALKNGNVRDIVHIHSYHDKKAGVLLGRTILGESNSFGWSIRRDWFKRR